VLSFSFLIAFLSAFMNNIGALGLMLPVSIKSAITQKRSPSLILMPIAMASALGGMITLIGTPPNLIVADFRAQAVGASFNIFDFGYVGLLTALFGVLFIGLVGWRLLPERRRQEKPYQTVYTVEIRIVPKSKWIGKPFKQFKKNFKNKVDIVGLIRRKRKHALSSELVIKSGDCFLINTDLTALQDFAHLTDFIIENQYGRGRKNLLDKNVLVEAIVPAKSNMTKSPIDKLNIRTPHHVTVLGIASSKSIPTKRIRKQILQPGDMVLLECKERKAIPKLLAIGFSPVSELSMPASSTLKTFFPLVIFGISILLIALKVLPAEISFAAAVLLMGLCNLTSLSNLHKNIDWSIIILLAAMIPIGNALSTTGGAKLISSLIFSASQHLPIIIIIALVLTITMILSDFINNAATAIVMSPIAISLAKLIGVNVDPLLMAVAVGASCAFLTPIGHQNNLLVMGPGKYKFFDYMRMGLPLEIIILLVATPLIYWFWYLH
jgi:di/tricarboxylate transporter